MAARESGPFQNPRGKTVPTPDRADAITKGDGPCGQGMSRAAVVKKAAAMARRYRAQRWRRATG